MPKLVVTDDSGNWVDSVYLPDTVVDQFREAGSVSDTILNRSNTIDTVRSERDSLQAQVRTLNVRWDSHVATLTEMVMDHESCSGCMDGKRQFLEDLGLPFPEKEFSITLRFTVNADNWDDNDYNLAEEIVSVIRDYASCVEGEVEVETFDMYDK